MVADVARGDGADYSTFHIIKLETLEIVGEYQGKPSLDMYAGMLNQVGRVSETQCLWLRITILIRQWLIDYVHPNLYHSIKSTHEYIEQHQEYKSAAVPGFTTSMKTRLYSSELEEFIRNKLITVYSTRTINEMKTFIWRNGKPQAMKGYHDDLIMALQLHVGLEIPQYNLVQEILIIRKHL